MHVCCCVCSSEKPAFYAACTNLFHCQLFDVLPSHSNTRPHSKSHPNAPDRRVSQRGKHNGASSAEMHKLETFYASAALVIYFTRIPDIGLDW
eukprot:44589-Eustigmatos_ZCMA.PRE.1